MKKTLLAAMMMAGAAAAAAGTEGVRVKPDATREEVRAALIAQGTAAPTDAEIDAILKDLRERAIVTTRVTRVTVAPGTAPGGVEAAAGEPYASLAGTHASMPLAWQTEANSYFLPVMADGKVAAFLLDSGATQTIFAKPALERLGLPMKATGLVAGGVGGAAQSFATRCDTLRVGPHLSVPAQAYPALAMGVRDGCDGLVGEDFLAAARALVDYRHHRLWYPATAGAAPVPAAAGMVTVPMYPYAGHICATVTVNGKPLRFVVDTGAQQSVIDAAAARALGLRGASGIEVGGSGAGLQGTRVAAVDTLAAGGVTVRRAPLVVLPLADVQGAAGERYDGLLGADFLHATDALMDVAGKRLHLHPNPGDIRDFARVGGEMFESDEALAAALKSAAWVGAIRTENVDVMGDVAGVTPERVTVRLRARVTEVLKGAKPAAGEPLDVPVTIPKRRASEKELVGLVSRILPKLVFLPAAGNPTPEYGACVWSDCPAAREQLKRVTAAK